MHHACLPKPAPCPACGKVLEASTFTKGTKVEPKPGDLSICSTCGAVSQFAADMTFLPFDFEASDEMDVAQKVEIRRMCAIVRARQKN